MTKKELRLVDKMLETYSDYHLSPAGCNDTPKEWVEEFSRDEMIAMDREYHSLNGDPEEHDPEVRYPLPDYCYVWLMRKKIQAAAKGVPDA